MTSTLGNVSTGSKPEMVESRVTLRFQSDRGREYIYDDVTGCIFPWNTLRETALSRHLFQLRSTRSGEEQIEDAAQYGPRDLRAADEFVARWHKNYGAFARAWTGSNVVTSPPPIELEQIIRSRSFELLLILTENCNLRCRYCALSDVYPDNRVRTSRKMSSNTAMRAIDWYVRLVAPQIAQNPLKRFGLSFYGGEPLV